jgi:hypothetical protein
VYQLTQKHNKGPRKLQLNKLIHERREQEMYLWRKIVGYFNHMQVATDKHHPAFHASL